MGVPTSMKANKGLYHLMALTAVIIWGTTFVSTKTLLAEGISPSDIMFYRFLLAYVVLWAYRPGLYLPQNWKDEGLFVLAGISGGSLYFWTENTALNLTLSANVALLLATAPILTVLLSRLCLKEQKIRTALIVGSLLALTGVACVVYNGHFVLQIHPLGDLLSLAAALSWAFYNVILKWLDGRYSTLEITRKVFFYGVITLLPVFAFHPLTYNPDILFRPIVIGNLLFLGLIASLCCFAIWNLAVKGLGTITTSHYIYLVSPIALGCAAWWLNEPVTSMALCGAALILGGVYIAEKGWKRPSIKRIFAKS